MKKQAVVAISSVIFAAASYTVMPEARAGWFGPDSYEECVLEQVHKLGKTAAYAIDETQTYCRKKFPKTAVELKAGREVAEKIAKINEDYLRGMEQLRQRSQAEEQERQRLQAEFDKDVLVYEKCSYDMKNRMRYIPDAVRDANEIERCMYEQKHGIRDPLK